MVRWITSQVGHGSAGRATIRRLLTGDRVWPWLGQQNAPSYLRPPRQGFAVLHFLQIRSPNEWLTKLVPHFRHRRSLGAMSIWSSPSMGFRRAFVVMGAPHRL